jgi:hypothetical protein
MKRSSTIIRIPDDELEQVDIIASLLELSRRKAIKFIIHEKFNNLGICQSPKGASHE